jgi:DNA-binding response OmpR family regulator
MSIPYSVLIAGLGRRIEEYLIPALQSEGYRVQTASGREALLGTVSLALDLVLLDLPRAEDVDQIGELRPLIACPLVVVGPARNDRLLISALEQGADDYVTRPFRTAELLARIRAQLRRHQRSHAISLSFGPLSLDPQGRRAMRDGAPLDLSTEEFTLLTLLAARPGNIYPAAFIAEQIWGYGRREEGPRLDGVVARLRALIEPDPRAPSVLGGDVASGFWLGGAARERHLNGER